jgi:hypothetical protein
MSVGLSSAQKKGDAPKFIIMNSSFDSNNIGKENGYYSDSSIPANIAHGCTNSTNKREELGSFIKDKSKEHLINAML